MALLLDPVEIRVLGSLVEKESTTPEYYPLTLNAVMLACNQKSNRDPVVSYEEDAVSDALASLESKGLVETVPGSRVEKYEERLAAHLNLGRRELALLDVLMLRGPQTVGELHTRAARMHEFSDNDEIEGTLSRMMEWQPEPLVMRLARVPGTREPRYAHLLAPFTEPQAVEAPLPAARDDGLASLRLDVTRLEQEIRDLRAEFAAFRKQFE